MIDICSRFQINSNSVDAYIILRVLYFPTIVTIVDLAR